MSASESWSAQREALAVEALRRSGHLRLQVHGESMLPALWPGDIGEVAACSINDTRCGDVVLAFQNGRFYLHRLVIRRDPDGFLTRGDSMPRPDPAFPPEAFLGRLIGVVRAGKTASAPKSLGSGSRALGTLFCFCGPARRFALKLHQQWRVRSVERLQLGNLTSNDGYSQT